MESQSILSLLYIDGDRSKPKIPFVGMILGNGTIRGHYSPWVETHAALGGFSIKLRRGSNNTTQTWDCTSSSCNWQIR